MMRRIGLLPPLLAMTVLTACSAGGGEPTAQDSPSASHGGVAGVGVGEVQGTATGGENLPPRGTVVAGVEHCTLEKKTIEDVDGGQLIREHFACRDDMSDPRVSGAVDYFLVTRVNSAVGAIWVSESATLTTSKGTWRGTALGALDFLGKQPMAPGVAPYNRGTVHWVGQGALTGLTYDMFVSGSNEGLGVAGWITETP